MASCERCWSEAGSNVERYMRMVETRDALGHPCTPEEQAGPYADECPKCGRRTVHQLCHICVLCGWTWPPKC